MRFDLSPFHFVAMVVSGAALLGAATVSAQTRSVRDTATAYGARLNAKGLPADTNPARMSLRIERYRPEASVNPTAAFQATTTDDKSRTTPVIAPSQPVDSDTGGQ